jgi:hypothetical protein
VSSVAPKLIIVALAIAALLWPRPVTAPIAAQHAPNDTVKVKEEIIYAPASPATVIRPSARPSPSSSVKSAATRRPADRPKGFVERARRTLLGDGRYRPEPFPRPGR